MIVWVVLHVHVLARGCPLVDVFSNRNPDADLLIPSIFFIGMEA